MKKDGMLCHYEWEQGRLPLSSFLFDIVLEFLASIIRGKGGIQFEKEKIKFPFFTNEMIVYVENHRGHTHVRAHTHICVHTSIPLLELISEFNNAVGHTLKKSIIFIYNSNRDLETEYFKSYLK